MKGFYALGSLLLTIVICAGCKNDIPGPTPPGPPWVTFTTPRLPDNTVNSLFVDAEHRVWIATKQGAAYFRDNGWSIVNKEFLKYTTYDNQGPHDTYTVNCITEGKDRSIWFALRGGGVARFNEFSQNGNTWVRYNQPTILFDAVSSITAEQSNASTFGEIWMATSIGVNRFIQTSTDGGGSWSAYGSPPLLTSLTTFAGTNPIDNTIWIGGQSGGAIQFSYYPTPQFASIRLPAGHDARINGMAFDADNTVWFAKETEVSSLNMPSGQWKHYDRSNTHGTLVIGEVHAVESDFYKTHWFGTDSGLVLLNDTTWSRISAGPSTFPHNTVTALKYDAKGNLWIGTMNGVTVYNPQGTKF